MNKAEKKELRITNIEVETYNHFCDTAKELNLDKKQLLDILLTTHKFFNFNLNEEEKKKLDYINSVLPDIFEKKIKQVIKSFENRLKNTDYHNADLNFKNSSKSSFLRIEQLIEELAAKNDNAKDLFDKKYINQKTIFDLSKEKKRLIPSTITVSCRTINQYLAINKDKVDNYNKKHDLNKDHNLKVFYFKKKNNKG